MSEFNDIVDTEGLDPSEEARLRRVHELLVQAGPPPDLPPALEHPHEPTDGEIKQFPLLPRRRWAVAAVIAAALCVIAFGGGYLTGHAKSKATAFKTARLVPMHGKTALAVIRIGNHDKAGNLPMEFEVTGLAQQHDSGAYYELWLSRNGKPTAPCGSFRVNERTTTVRLTVPYKATNFDGWVVTRQPAHDHAPGPVVMTT
jgi:hypothetical protein